MSNSHFKYVCQFGQVHGQCRCMSSNKTVREVECNTPQRCAEKQVEVLGSILKNDIVTVDLDSTLCNTGHRHHLIDRVNGTDWNAYSLACVDDSPIAGMIEVVRILAKTPGIEVHALSGRAVAALEPTLKWFANHGVPIAQVWLDEHPEGWSAQHTHAEYKLWRLRQIEEKTGKRVRVHFDDWAEVAVHLEKHGVPCVCVRTPQEIEELVGGPDNDIR